VEGRERRGVVALDEPAQLDAVDEGGDHAREERRLDAEPDAGPLGQLREHPEGHVVHLRDVHAGDVAHGG